MRWIAIFTTIFFLINTDSSRATETIELAPKNKEEILEKPKTEPLDTDTSQVESLLSVSQEMRQFVQSFDPKLKPRHRFKEIIKKLKKDGFKIEFDLNHTTNAAEAFAERRGNCISFSALIVALARESGLEAHFNRVDAPTARSTLKTRRGRQVTQKISHVNAEVKLGKSSKIIEFNFKPKKNFPHKKLSDREIKALYANNLALELTHNGKLSEALDMIKTGLNQDSKTSTLWNTKGYIHRQKNELQLAEKSYLKALEINARSYAARKNLIRIYELKGTQS